MLILLLEKHKMVESYLMQSSVLLWFNSNVLLIVRYLLCSFSGLRYLLCAFSGGLWILMYIQKSFHEEHFDVWASCKLLIKISIHVFFFPYLVKSVCFLPDRLQDVFAVLLGGLHLVAGVVGLQFVGHSVLVQDQDHCHHEGNNTWQFNHT